MAQPTTLQRLARRALLTAAKADTALTALVPAGSIDPDGETAWPIVLIEAPVMRGLLAACVKGASVSFDIHAFAKPREDAGSVVETGYDHASRIGAAIETVFAGMLVLENNATCALRWSDARLLKDASPDDWHWFGQLNCRVLAAPA